MEVDRLAGGSIGECLLLLFVFFFFSSRRRHTRLVSDWSSDVCSSDLIKFMRKMGMRFNIADSLIVS